MIPIHDHVYNKIHLFRQYYSQIKCIGPASFELNQQFYRDAEKGGVENFHLVYRTDTGLVLVKKELFQQYFMNDQ